VGRSASLRRPTTRTLDAYKDMNHTDTSHKIENYVGYTIGLVSAVISVGLAVLTVAIAVRRDPSNSEEEVLFAIIFGIIIPFAIFFGVVALRSLTPNMAKRKELMTINSWRMLAALLLSSGVIGFVYGHWFALVLPGVMAIICMMKDSRFIEKLRSIGLLQ